MAETQQPQLDRGVVDSKPINGSITFETRKTKDGTGTWKCLNLRLANGYSKLVMLERAELFLLDSEN